MGLYDTERKIADLLTEHRPSEITIYQTRVIANDAFWCLLEWHHDGEHIQFNVGRNMWVSAEENYSLIGKLLAEAERNSEPFNGWMPYWGSHRYTGKSVISDPVRFLR